MSASSTSRRDRASASSAPRIVVVGSSNTDLVVRCDRLPKPGETLLGGEFTQAAGGKGANQAVAAARAGARVTFIGGRGEDGFGQAAKRGLAAEGIDTRYFRPKRGASSGIALILIGGRSRENVIAVARSANDLVSAGDVTEATAAFRGADAVICQLEIPPATVEAAALLAQESGARFILNPAPARRLPSGLLRLVDTLVPNEHEALLLTGSTAPESAAALLQKRGCKNVVITLGARGALVCDTAGCRRVAAPKVKPVDTVGAGDCFTGWLAAGLGSGLDLDDSVRRAVRAAAIAVTRAGAQSGMPYAAELG